MLFPLSASTGFRTTGIALVAGIGALGLASRIAIPMVPVPITGQTLVVTLIGALYGPRLGMFTVVAWLIAAALGLPLLAEGASGIARFTGATGGYLIAFPFAAGLVGYLARHGHCARSGPAFAVMLAGNAVCLAIGTVWLAGQKGAGIAIQAGLLPFVPGAIIKSALAALIASRLIRP
ncbi:biotin transporter BioY [Sphingomonas naphthae]|uniref:Biotin transporter n=1 Tax=Sphingomonas naphthae TaxID=1813468 RepID=A0ABY7TFF5_9SPHN|nr:biotin transporter BioY [Sphingomonas naphthae]WCT71869.1 biotin transporter BioY [Sphingomonas naphthae]